MSRKCLCVNCFVLVAKIQTIFVMQCIRAQLFKISIILEQIYISIEPHNTANGKVFLDVSKNSMHYCMNMLKKERLQHT